MGCESSRVSNVAGTLVGENRSPLEAASSSSANASAASGTLKRNGRPHKRLVAVSRYEHPAVLTSEEVLKERSRFWETRIEGREDSWQTLKGVAQALIDGDVALANALLDAAEFTSPNGSLELCYDSYGEQYAVPTLCYATPSNVARSSSDASPDAAGSTAIDHGSMEADVKGRDPTEVMDESMIVNLKVRIVNSGITVAVRGWKNCRVADIHTQVARELLKRDDVDYDSPPRKMRLFYMGKEMSAGQLLSTYAVGEKHIILVHILQRT